MSFNTGFMCPNCGPIEKSKDRTIQKVKHMACPTCSAVVKEWSRPLNQRKGRRRNCAGGGFQLALVKRKLMRCCKICKQVENTDDGNKVVREGDKKYGYRKTTKNKRI